MFAKGSPVKNTEIDFELYTLKQLSPDFKLYWRILKDLQELEAVLVVNGTSYVGLGWRPSKITAECKNFPLIAGEPKPEPVSEPEPESTPEPEPKSEPEPEPKSEPEPQSEPEPEPKSEAEPEPVSKSESTSRPFPKIVPPRKTLFSREIKRVGDEETKADAIATSVSFKVTAKQGRKKRETGKYKIQI